MRQYAHAALIHAHASLEGSSRSLCVAQCRCGRSERRIQLLQNYCNEISLKTATRSDTKRKWLSGFDLCKLTAGAGPYFDKIGADTIQWICTHYAQKRQAARRLKLRWRVSRGPKRSLGWIPFKAASIKRKGVCLRFAGKCFRVVENERLEGVKWQGGCFAQDAVGDWFLCLPVKMEAEETVAPYEVVGIDLGLKDIAVTSDGDRLAAGRWTLRVAEKLVRTRMAKSVLDSGWGMLKCRSEYPDRVQVSDLRARE
jgi:putative transposase